MKKKKNRTYILLYLAFNIYFYIPACEDEDCCTKYCDNCLLYCCDTLEEEESNINLLSKINKEKLTFIIKHIYNNFYTKNKKNEIKKSTYTKEEQEYIIEELSKGYQGDIYKVTTNGVSFIVKRINERYAYGEDQENKIKGENAIMKCLNKEEGVVNFYFSCCYKGILFIVMEYCELGDLENYLKNNKEEAKQNYKDFSLQILNILKVLRNKKIIHRDIKPENFIMKKNEDKIIIKLCDFGASAISEGKSELYIGYHKYKSNIFKQWYIKYYKEGDQKAFFNPFNEDLFSAAVILYRIYNNGNFPNFTQDYIRGEEESFLFAKFTKDIQAFNDYFNTEDYTEYKDEIYNKIFWKFKEKKDNDTIGLDEFINEVNP